MLGGGESLGCSANAWKGAFPCWALGTEIISPRQVKEMQEETDDRKRGAGPFASLSAAHTVSCTCFSPLGWPFPTQAFLPPLYR